MAWERYYLTLRRLPRRLKKPVPFVVEDLRRYKINSVLDLGCGAGRPSVHLAKNSFDVVGVDISKSALGLANTWARKEKLKNIALVRGTMTNLPFCNDHFDAVVSVSVVHHAVKKDILKTITEVHRVLRKNGIFLANLASVKDPRYGVGEKVENNTFKTLEGFEEKRFEELHHYFSKREVSTLLSRFSRAEIKLLEEKPNYWKVTAMK